MAKATTMGPMKIKESASYRVFKVFNAIILTLISVAMLYPFLYLVAQSFSSTEAIVAGEVGLIPKDFNISTYKYVITDGKFIPYYGNTIVYSIIGTVCALLFSALLAYPLSKAELYGGKAINKFIIFTMYFGGGMIPNYILMVSLGLRDTVASFILPGMISTYYVILMRSFFLTLPRELEEAGEIDGLDKWGVFWRIAIPLSKPIIATMTLFYVVQYWNDWFDAFLYLDTTTKWPVAYYLRQLISSASGTSPYIIPKIYSETAYVTGGGVVPVSDYVQYMPNYSNFVEEYNMQDDLATITQADGKYYRLPGLKETSLQDYTFLIRKDIFDAAGYDVAELEKDWTWDEFADVLIGVKKYMVEQGMCGENDYIWSDMWCGQTSGYGQGGNLLKLLGASYDINTGWAITTNYGLVYDADSDSFVDGSVSDNYKQAYTVLQKLVQNKVLDPETWTQDDDTALNKFYRGETAIMSTNRAQYATQDSKIKEQLGEGNYELYRTLVPIGTSDYQAENQRLECGIMISSNALKELGEDEFIKMMRFVDWLWYSDEGLTLTKWGKEGETYTVTDGTYSLTPGYYCNGLSIAQTSDDQIDLREELGYACGNFMYSGNTELLTSNFSEDLRDFYDRQGQYRKLRPLDPTVTFDEDQMEMLNLWGTPMTDTVNAWTCKFAMNQADINNDWDTYVAEVEAQNMQNIVDMYNDTYNASK